MRSRRLQASSTADARRQARCRQRASLTSSFRSPRSVWCPVSGRYGIGSGRSAFAWGLHRFTSATMDAISSPPLHSIFFGAFHALAIDYGGGGAGFSFRLLAAGDVERMVSAIQHTIAVPPDEVVVDRAVRRKVLRKVAPLATGTEDIHHPVHDRTHVGPPLATAGLGRRNQWCNIRPLVIREVARVPQVITIVFRSVLKRPHRRHLRESGHLL